MSDDKKLWSLNPIEQIGYKCLTQAFVGAYIVKDILDLNKNDKE